MSPRSAWSWLVALFRRLAGWISGRRRDLARRAGQSDFLSAAARRLVATGIPNPGSTRVWVRSDCVGEHVLVLHGPGGAPRRSTFDVPADPSLDGTVVVPVHDLQPHTSYRFDVIAPDGSSVGSGRFTTPPRSEADAPDRFAIAIASCHQPFSDDGSLCEAALRPIDALPALLDRHDVRALLLLGDQMYTDLPAGHSLFDDAMFRRVAPPGRRCLLDCTRAEVRALLQQRYRAFWKVDAFARLQAQFPTICMLDDHELVDNFGSDPEHATEAWAAFVEGALDAFHDYQALRAHDRPRPSAFATRFAWGPLAALVLDLRSQRNSTKERTQVMGEEQWALLDRFLSEELARPVLMLGLTIPLLHAPEWLVAVAATVAPRGSAAHERWSHPLVAASRDRLVHRLLEHRRAAPHQRVILVSGDVHVGTVCEVTFDGELPMLQVVSSALSNLESTAVREGSGDVARLGPEFETAAGVHCAATLIPGVEGADANPYQGLNASIIEVYRAGPRWDVRVRLVGSRREGGSSAEIVYDSGLAVDFDAADAAARIA